MAEPSSGIVPSEIEIESGGAGGREYRKGNWTLQETMILIQAKKLDDERRLKGGEKEKGKSAEFRWKWVENHCWKHGCQRSQNQCNDKWDNLLRDYKKVREYESKVQPGSKSYWQLEKHERKERGLPSNMIIQVYDALHEVVDKRPKPAVQESHIPQQIRHVYTPPMHLPGPSSAPLPPVQPPPPPAEASKGTDSEGSDTERRSPKRQRMSTDTHELAPTLSKSAYELTQTLLACEERKDKRHRDILSVEERKLVLEEAKAEISRQGMEGLITAVNNLASAILTLASDRQPPPS